MDRLHADFCVVTVILVDNDPCSHKLSCCGNYVFVQLCLFRFPCCEFVNFYKDQAELFMSSNFSFCIREHQWEKNPFNFETCNPIYINLKLDVAPPRQSASHLLEKKGEKERNEKACTGMVPRLPLLQPRTSSFLSVRQL